MRVLVCTRHFGYLRNFESAIAALAERGHDVHLAADRPESLFGGDRLVARLVERYPNVTVGTTPPRDKDPWLLLSSRIRLSRDFLRYLDPRFDGAPQLRRRAKERTPAGVVWLIERAGFRRRPMRTWLAAVLEAAEQALPLHAPTTAFIHDQRPDVVVLTPLIDLGSPQLDLLKSARSLGVRTVVAVGSWDHLSSKALIRIQPDLLTVWNQVQQREAVEMHGVPAEKITVTGAQCYDQWFGRQPSRTREAFCREVGLPADRPFVVWVCSSLFRGGPPEAPFVLSWIRALRASADPTLCDLGILVRPHPGRLDEWESHDLSSLDRVVFTGRNPIDQASRDDYFDALYHSAAVVGLNTSAFLEAAIAGKPVMAILPREYWKSQTGTIHFHYLRDVAGGVLQTAATLEEHAGQLARVVADGRPAIDPAPFVQAFLRPAGLDQPSTPRFVDAIERAAQEPAPRPWRKSAGGRLLSPALHAYVWSRRAIASARLRLHDGKREIRKTGVRLKRVGWQVAKRTVLEPLGHQVRPTIVPLQGGEPDFSTLPDVRDTIAGLRALAERPGPVIVGPWISEAGFELLYWIPFVAWAARHANLRRDRLVVVSRGGTARWYAHIATRYRDVFAFMTPDEFRTRNEARIAGQEGQKHFEISELDEDIYRRVAHGLGVASPSWLHPSTMYQLFRPYWLQQLPTDLVRAFTAPQALELAGLAKPAGLPDRYIAVKFYGNLALPYTDANRAFVADAMGRLTRRHHVVLLQTGVQFDDHDDFATAAPGRIHAVDHLMTPQTNLDVQTAVIRHADALVGTYGGFSYLGPFAGARTLTFYSEPTGFRIDHQEMALRTFREIGAPSFVALQTRDISTLDRWLGLEAACAPSF